MPDGYLVCFAVGGDSLAGGMNLAPGIAAFLLVCASPVVGLIVVVIMRLIARRRVDRWRIAAIAGLTTFLIVLGFGIGCWYEIGPLPDLARWAIP